MPRQVSAAGGWRRLEEGVCRCGQALGPRGADQLAGQGASAAPTRPAPACKVPGAARSSAFRPALGCRSLKACEQRLGAEEVGWVIPEVTSGDDTPVVKWGLPGQSRPVRVAGQAEGKLPWDICQVGPRKRGATGPRSLCGSPILLASAMCNSLSVPWSSHHAFRPVLHCACISVPVPDAPHPCSHIMRTQKHLTPCDAVLLTKDHRQGSENM